MLWALKLPVPRRTSISDAAHLTLIAMANPAHENGRYSFQSADTLADIRSVDVRTIRRHLKQLEDAGLIIRGDQSAVDRIPANRRPVVWDLAMTPASGVTDVSPQPGLWGDTTCPPGVTPGVLQHQQEPRDVSTHVTPPARTRARRRHDDDAPDFPGRECLHGVEAVHIETKHGRRWQCPQCARQGFVQLAPQTVLTPDQIAEAEAFRQSIRDRAQERANA